MNAMARLNKLNQVHGTQTNIHVFNMFYGVDWLRISMADFEVMLGGITAADVMRVSMLSGSTKGNVNEVAELLAA